AFQLPALPADTTGSVRVGVQGGRSIPYVRGGASLSYTEAAPAQVTAVKSDGSDAAGAPRMVITQERCDACHAGGLAMHGGTANSVALCSTCHVKGATDAEVRPAEAGAPVSIEFPVLVHKI